VLLGDGNCVPPNAVYLELGCLLVYCPPKCDIAGCGVAHLLLKYLDFLAFSSTAFKSLSKTFDAAKSLWYV